MPSRYYACRNCGYVLDIVRGVSDEQCRGNDGSILPTDPKRSSIDDVPDIWQCPECMSSREEFEEAPDAAPPDGGDAPLPAPSQPAAPAPRSSPLSGGRRVRPEDLYLREDDPR